MELGMMNEEHKDSRTSGKAWGRLSSMNAAKANTVELIDGEYTMGRGDDAKIVIKDKRLSHIHCVVLKKVEGGRIKAFLEDRSTNGTFINDFKIGKGNLHEIHNGDTVNLLPANKVPADEMISFVFLYADSSADTKRKDRDTDDMTLLEETKKSTKLSDNMAQNLSCGICYEYIYQAATLIPCMHTFCGACISDCLQRDKKLKRIELLCPTCRKPAEKIVKDHSVNNLVEQLLLSRPDKRRSAADYKEMNDKNRILQDVDLKILAAKARKKQLKAAPDSEDSDQSYQSNDDDDLPAPQPVRTTVVGGRNICKECSRAGPTGHICGPDTNHILCSACKHPMPDRQKDGIKQCCLICRTYFCSLYWDCAGKGRSRLFLVKNAPIKQQFHENFFRGNPYEALVLQRYLGSTGKGPNDIWDFMLHNYLERGRFVYEVSNRLFSNHVGPPVQTKIEPDSAICTNCWDNVWFQIVFRYRIIIKDELPPALSSRINCYYGINCRTMTHKRDHAEKLDHICEQTKF
jgi:E3 ubiquitin-protein ligase CHFR